MIAAELQQLDVAILELEGLWFAQAGSKEQAIRERTGLTSTAYYRRLATLLDEPAALRAYPTLVHRLRARRDRRAAARERRNAA